MKKLLSTILCLCMLCTTFHTSVFAADEISTFGITMSGFKGGAKESDVTFSLSDDRLEISQVSWVGTMKEDGTFKNQKVYNVFVTVKIKSGTDTTFSPGKTCTRAQIVTFLWRAAQKGLI